MNDLLIGVLGVALATNQPQAVSNLVQQTTGMSVAVTDPNDPVEKEYQKILDQDDASQAEVDRWLKENEKFAGSGGGLSTQQMRERIQTRFVPVRKAYEDFIKKNPDHARAHLAYGSFLNDIGDEDGAEVEWDKARLLNPKDPAAWNNLANLYGHHSPVKKAFEYYAKAIELNPFEPVYYHNFGTTVFLFRVDAKEYYGIDEQQVFNKALELYNKALKLDPDNFPLATDVAQTYYGIQPFRPDEAIKAWDYALKIAGDDVEREGVHIHLARVKIRADCFDDARVHLNAVTNAMYDVVKARLWKNLKEWEAKAKVASTNSVMTATNSPEFVPTK